MSFIESLTDLLAVMLCQYLRSESRDDTECVPGKVDNQSMKKSSDGRDGEDSPKTKALAS